MQCAQAGARVGERFWQLPMDDEYRELIKSDIADIKNSAGARRARSPPPTSSRVRRRDAVGAPRHRRHGLGERAQALHG